VEVTTVFVYNALLFYRRFDDHGTLRSGGSQYAHLSPSPRDQLPAQTMRNTYGTNFVFTITLSTVGSILRLLNSVLDIRRASHSMHLCSL